MTHSSCPAGCGCPICERNIDPAGELRILGQNLHYSPTHVIEILLRKVKIIDPVSDEAEWSDDLKRSEAHRRLDVILVESKKARRLGERSDLGRYDERFAGIEVSWEPMQMKGRDGAHDITSAPHAIHIQVSRPPVGPDTRSAEARRPVKALNECLWTSGQQFNTLSLH